MTCDVASHRDSALYASKITVREGMRWAGASGHSSALRL
jgi:hypothetical protein